MTERKQKIYFWFSMLYVLITGGFNLYGYFHLPSDIATQISFSGEQVNQMPTHIYMLATFGIVLLISLFCITKGQEQKLKFLLVNTILVIANIIMIVIQL